VDQPARQQIRLILEDATDRLKSAVNDRTNGVYRTHASRGMLQSGQTLIACVEAMEEEASNYITACVDQVKAVAMDPEAFAMVRENFEVALTFLSKKIDTVFITSTGGRFTPDDIGPRKASLARFSEARDRLGRQLELHRFTFVVPFSPRAVDPTANLPETAVAKPKGGKPLAAHWDEMWAAIAVALYTGDLQLRTQADIERAMKDWLASKDINAADSSVRKRAQQLWRKLQESE
jgi:hypothetical protein